MVRWGNSEGLTALHIQSETKADQVCSLCQRIIQAVKLGHVGIGKKKISLYKKLRKLKKKKTNLINPHVQYTTYVDLSVVQLYFKVISFLTSSL